MKRRPLKSICPRCRAGARQVRDGRNKSGSLRARCRLCGHGYTLLPNSAGYGRKIVARVINSYLRMRRKTRFALKDKPNAILLNPTEEQLSRKVARKYGINHQTLLNWLHDWPETVSFYHYIMTFPIRSTIDNRIRVNRTNSTGSSYSKSS
jgi:transposase-like protein